jgi:tRNA threonylcarbamoyladenosine biosynthesis protein TsaB
MEQDIMLLALDTSSQLIGVALYNGADVLSEMSWYSPNYHTIQLAPTVAEILKRSGFEITDLQALAVALGPGSFTGLRVGIAFIKGLALACHLPLFGIPTLDIVAAAQPLKQDPAYPVYMAAVLQAGRGRLAIGWYQAEGMEKRTRRRSTLQPLPKQHWRSTGELQLLTSGDLVKRIQAESNSTGPILVCGELDSETRSLLEASAVLASPARSLRRSSYLAELAWERWQAGRVDDPATLTPIYLRTEQVPSQAALPT